MFRNFKVQFLVFVSWLSASSSLLARDLSNVEIYRRCYAQLTQQSLPFNDTRLAAVKAGTKTPVAACMEVLDSARFETTTHNRLAAPADPLAQQVLATMNQVHQTFFLVNDIPAIAGGKQNPGMRGIYDAGEPALYYTKALFDSTTNFKFVVTANVNLRADRSGNSPVTSTEGIAKADSIFAADTNFSWASIGTLLGVKSTGLMPATYPTATATATVNLGETRGGGVLGTQTYLLETVNEPPTFKANSFTMPRKWAKSIFNDFLCRDLPVARLVEDTNSFVDTAANANEFRKSAACTQCHASMDRMASVNRNFKYQSVGANTPTSPVGTLLATTYPTTATLDGSTWPSVITDNYSARPTLGTLYYRDYKGVLVNSPISSIADLGAKMATTDDFYICAAKHYYKYFMGVDVDVFDPEDGRYRNKGTDMTAHKTNVINLGLALKTNQSLRTLINSILNLGVYKKSGLGIQGQ